MNHSVRWGVEILGIVLIVWSFLFVGSLLSAFCLVSVICPTFRVFSSAKAY